MIDLILGARGNGLGIARSLGEGDIKPYVVDFSTNPICASSRYILDYFRVEPNDDSLISLISNISKDDDLIVYPTDDSWVSFIYRNSEHLRNIGVAYPWVSVNDIEDVLNKRRFYNRFHKRYLMPSILPFEKREENKSIIKAEISHCKFNIAPKGVKASKVDRINQAGVNVLVQERIKVPLDNHFSVSGLRFNEKLVSPIVTCKVLEYPNPGGTATMVATVQSSSLREDLIRLAANVLKDLKLIGAFEVEIICKGEEFYLIEINPRFWLQHRLGVVFGINYPLIYRNYILTGGSSHRDKEFAGSGVWVHEGACVSLLNLSSLFSSWPAKLLSADNIMWAHYDSSDIRPFWRFLRSAAKF